MQAYICSAILEKLPHDAGKIECLASWGNCLLLGTTGGTSGGLLLVYEVLKRPDSKEFDARILDTVRGFGRKAVTQLAVVARSNLLLRFLSRAGLVWSAPRTNEEERTDQKKNKTQHSSTTQHLAVYRMGPCRSTTWA